MRKARVTFRVPGFHYWPTAPDRRAYLGVPHRHLFHVRVDVEVFADDREIEFHDLLEFAKVCWPMRDDPKCDDLTSTYSCEKMAASMIRNLAVEYPGRALEVEVSEDGECGAVVTFP